MFRNFMNIQLETSWKKLLEKEFETKYNSGLQLITLRHYTPFLIDFVTSDKEIFLEQRSRSTFQVLVK